MDGDVLAWFVPATLDTGGDLIAVVEGGELVPGLAFLI